VLLPLALFIPIPTDSRRCIDTLLDQPNPPGCQHQQHVRHTVTVDDLRKLLAGGAVLVVLDVPLRSWAADAIRVEVVGSVKRREINVRRLGLGTAPARLRQRRVDIPACSSSPVSYTETPGG
jgi:hypothetical protein